MNSKLSILLFATVLVIPMVAAEDISIKNNISNQAVPPGNTTHIGAFTVNTSNQSVNLTNIVTNKLPFELDYMPNTAQIQGSQEIEVSASVPEGFSPGLQNGETIFVFENKSDIRKQVQVDVANQKSWAITNTSFKNNISVGGSGKTGEIQIKNTGNTHVSFQPNVTGNFSEFLTPDPFTVYRNTESIYVLDYKIPKTTEFGYYTATITFLEGNQTKNFTVETRLLDEIRPRLKTKSFKGFPATKPTEFTVQATDNLDIGEVTAKLIYEKQIQRNNSTVTVNRTLEEIEFNHKKNTDNWVGEMENADRIGEYYVEGTIKDEAGNNVTFTDYFNVTPLDVISVEESIELPAYKYDAELQHNVGSIERDTPIDITLKSFNQPLNSNSETWSVGLVTPSGKKFFNDVNETITIEQAGDIRLHIYSDTAEKYQGELKYTPIDEHVSVPTTTFYSRYTNYTSPKDKVFEAFGKLYVCDGHSSKVLSKAYWKCSVNISAETVPPGSNLGEEVQLIIPKQAKEAKEQNWLTQIRTAEKGEKKAENKADFWFKVAFVSIATGGFSTLYLVFVHSSYYWIYLPVLSRRKQAKTGAKKLANSKLKSKIKKIIPYM